MVLVLTFILLAAILINRKNRPTKKAPPQVEKDENIFSTDPKEGGFKPKDLKKFLDGGENDNEDKDLFDV